MKYAQNNRNELNYQTIADMMYTDACERYRKFGKAIIEYSDYDVFTFAKKIDDIEFIFEYKLEDIVRGLDKIQDVVAQYYNNGPIDVDQDDEGISLTLTSHPMSR